jgi:hypothetical protein
MQLNLNNSNEKNLSNEKRNSFSNFISNFISELSNYLENYNKIKNLTYCVMSDVDENGEMYVVAQNGTGAGKSFSLDELPSGTTKGTILRQKYGKFVIDEELTKKSIDKDNKLEYEHQKLLAEYKTEGVDYLVTEIGDDYVMLQNQSTGLEFDSSDFKQEVFDALYEGAMLTCKYGEYALKNN